MTSTAQAVTVDFSLGPTGDIGPTFTDSAIGALVLGMWCNGDEPTCTSSSGVWSPADLWRRNDNNGLDLGLGVCDPSEGTLCATGTANSAPDEFNELSDRTAPELIYLKLPAGYQWVSVTLSSLDDNSAEGGAPERGILWADVDTTPNNGNAEVVTSYTGTNNGTPFTVDIPSTFGSSPYLFLEPFDFTGGGSTNNDHLVYQVTLTSISSTTTSTATSTTTTSTTTTSTTGPPTTTTTTVQATTTTRPRATTTTTVPIRVRCCVPGQGEEDDQGDDQSEGDQSGEGGRPHRNGGGNGAPNCRIVTPSECRAQGGRKLGRGTCDPNPCPHFPQRRDSNGNESD